MSIKKEKCNNSNSSSNIQLFYYEGLSVRTISIDDEIWFVAKDVADILGYNHTPHATRLLDDDEKALFNPNTSEIISASNSVSNSEDTPKVDMLKNTDTTPTSYSGVEITIISEPGLYELVFRSNKPDAKAFSRWVRHEVLPSIRKTGSYSIEKHSHDRETSTQLAVQKAALNERITFWKSLYNASRELSNILLAVSPRNTYIVPDPIRHNDNDNSEVHLMRCQIKDFNEFLSRKINLLERKFELIDTFLDD